MASTLTRTARTLGRGTVVNLSVAELYEHAARRDEGIISAHGSLVVHTGQHTGRSPKDKFIVREAGSADKIWWGEINQPISEAHYDRLRARLMRHIEDRQLYAQDCYIGAHPAHRRALRVYTEAAWASIFARNLFRRPPLADLARFTPNFTIIAVPSFTADPATDGTRSGTAILLHLGRMEVIIVGTQYAGEIKKSAFTVMNYLLPDEGALPMHSSVNVGKAGDPALFFGLSGTGKTTLSADPERSLIGDDEHGWGADGLFNFEGGCYAKTIRLSPMYEPDIFATTRRFGTVLENVTLLDNGIMEGTIIDITDRKRAEEALRRREEQVAQRAHGHRGLLRDARLREPEQRGGERRVRPVERTSGHRRASKGTIACAREHRGAPFHGVDRSPQRPRRSA